MIVVHPTQMCLVGDDIRYCALINLPISRNERQVIFQTRRVNHQPGFGFTMPGIRFLLTGSPRRSIQNLCAKKPSLSFSSILRTPSIRWFVLFTIRYIVSCISPFATFSSEDRRYYQTNHPQQFIALELNLLLRCNSLLGKSSIRIPPHHPIFSVPREAGFFTIALLR